MTEKGCDANGDASHTYSLFVTGISIPHRMTVNMQAPQDHPNIVNTQVCLTKTQKHLPFQAWLATGEVGELRSRVLSLLAVSMEQRNMISILSLYDIFI